MGSLNRDQDMDSSRGTTSVPVADATGRKYKVGRGKGKDNILTQPLLGSESSEEEIMVAEPKEEVLMTTIKEPEEASWQIALQVFFPYLIAGLGMVGAGMVLDIVQVSLLFLFFSPSKISIHCFKKMNNCSFIHGILLYVVILHMIYFFYPFQK